LPAGGFGEVIGEDLGLFVPNENVRPAFARRAKESCDSGIGGTGISCNALFRGNALSTCTGTSVDEGSVEEELNRAEEAELSYKPPVEAELLVPPLPLERSQYEIDKFSEAKRRVPITWLISFNIGEQVVVFLQRIPRRAQWPPLAHSFESICSIERSVTASGPFKYFKGRLWRVLDLF
jgi:hypothetical protein